MRAAPNKSLQRTRLRAPLSSDPLGRPRVIRTAVACFAFALAFRNQATACSCGAIPAPEQAFVEASAVRLVTVTKVSDKLWFGKRLWYTLVGHEHSDYADYVSRFGFEITAHVDRTFKGPADSSTRFLTGRGGGDCGLPFKRGNQYLLYLGLYGAQGLSIVGMCSRTAPGTSASADLAFLQGHP